MKPLCNIPIPMTDREGEIYKKIHEMHCALKEERNHECVGTVSISATCVILSCPKCGDAKRLIPEPK